MSRPRKFSDEDEATIVADYVDGTLTWEQLQQKWNTTSTTIAAIARRHGVLGDRPDKKTVRERNIYTEKLEQSRTLRRLRSDNDRYRAENRKLREKLAAAEAELAILRPQVDELRKFVPRM